mgnify:CR=1 FL=1
MKKLTLVSLILILLSNVVLAQHFQKFTAKAIVLAVEDEVTEEEESSIDSTTFERDVQMVKVRVTSGKYKGQTLLIQNEVSSSFLSNVDAKVNDKLIIDIIEEEGYYQSAHISDYQRDWYVYLLVAVFMLVLIELAHYDGLRAIGSLVVTLVLIYKVLLPLLIQGYNPVLLTGGIAVVVAFLVMLFKYKASSETWSAIAGTIVGIAAATGLTLLGGKWINLTGLSADEVGVLSILINGELDFTGLLAAGIIIGSLGAVMTTAMSVASTMKGIKDQNPQIHFKELFALGINKGRKLAGAMSNTLIMAYLGTSIPILLLFEANRESFLKIINMDIIVGEIVRAIAGSIGLMIAIPVTALVMALIEGSFVERDYYIEE